MDAQSHTAPHRRGLPVGMALSLGLLLAAPTAAHAATDASSLAGRWQLSCLGRGDVERHALLQIRQDGATLSGTASGGGRSGPLSGSVTGTAVSLRIGASARAFVFAGTMTGNAITGQSRRGRPCSVTRQ